MTGQYKAYPEYKDSGVEWVGSIPTHWVCAKTAHFFKVAMGQTILKEDLVDDGEWPVFSATEGDHYFGRINDPNVQLNIGDIVIPARGTIGAIKLVKEKATTSQTTIYCKQSQRNKIQPSYIYYFFSGERKNLFRFTQTAIPQITTEEVGSNPILIPTLEEQEKIASFLDYQTTKIDNLVSAQESLITLLKEKRQALISHVVTKGLDPDVEMKDSGVEWQGDAPRHWIRGNLNRFGTFLGGSGFPIDAQGESTGDIPFYKVSDTNIPGNEKYLAAANNYISFDVAKSLGARIAPSGGIMFPKVGAALLGNKRRILFERAITDNNTMVFIPKDNNSEFWYYALLIMDFGQLSNPGPVPSVNESQLKRFEYVAPSAKERSEIADYLNAKLPPIETLITEVQESIDLLKEHRAALISATVTGKIDVRDWEVNA